MAKISVILPCYNVSAYIDRCLTSIINQTIGVDALEIICVDDASTDNTWQKLQDWEKKYSQNIIVIHCDENGRQGRARNIGLSYASCEWVGFVDADDWIEPDYFEKLYFIATNIKCDIVGCAIDRDFSSNLSFFDNRKTGKDDRYMVIDTVEKRKTFLVFQSMGANCYGKLIRRSLLLSHQIYFPENLAYEDNYTASLLHLYTSKVYLSEEILYHYYVNPNSTVLKKQADYHPDLLTVHSHLFREWNRRGFFELYHDEFEYSFLVSCYLPMIKILVLRYEIPPYSLYLFAREFVLNKFPSFENNIYLKRKVHSEFYNLMLVSLKYPLSKSEFIEFAKSVKTIGL